MNRKKIAVFTGTRAEYGLLKPVIQKLRLSQTLEPLLVVTGAHLSEEYGSTVSEIERDKMPIAARIPILKFGHTPRTTADTVAYAIGVYTDWLTEQKPDAVLLLGDRYEIFAAAQAAGFARIPVAHISGGDVTLGAADDWYRHCVTKIAHIHFPSCEEYANRVIRMGEKPETVHNVGGLGDENIRTMPKMTRQQLSESLNFDLSGPFGLVTFHPITAGEGEPTAQMQALLNAMEQVSRETGTKWLITKANADAGGADINRLIDSWTEQHREQAIAFTSLGVVRYLSAMQQAALVAGNSSSGVVETPTFGVPTVNIGTRQAGRIICPNVICCEPEEPQILAALKKCFEPEFIGQARATVSPYNGGDTSGRIVSILEQAVSAPGFGAPKGFYDG